VKASVTRRYQFSASHRLHSDALSEAENDRVFGKCNNPYGHGHNYELEVTVRGPVDAQTGLVVTLELLDDYVRRVVVQRFASRNINLDVPEFERLVPTTENIALVIARYLSAGWYEFFGPTGPVLTRVHIQETARNGFELLLPELMQDQLPSLAETGELLAGAGKE
jgi:6-pyruvoyltetrahydropterin/6-carboxytetrahydropterin synthase